jgi:hypothetical protein
LRVYVTNKRNQPLMPTTPKKARLLLGAGKAKVVNQIPFTIQLLYATGEHIQVISLGIDAGTKHIGVSATSEKEVLFEAEIILRTDVVELLATRHTPSLSPGSPQQENPVSTSSVPKSSSP